MSSKELIGRLIREADEQARTIRQEAEAEAGQVREETRRKIEALSLRYREREADAVREKTAGITADAEREARETRLETEMIIVSRLRELAFATLTSLRGDGYGTAFRVLAAEIPKVEWKTVRVNPADSALAEAAFPDVEVQGESSITGGMEVASEDGRVRVINTFEKRLERAWEGIVPKLLAEVYETHAGD